MAFGDILGNPAVAGALSLGAGLATGYAKERQTQADHRRRMAEIRYRQQLGLQDYSMRRAINSRFPSPTDQDRMARRAITAQQGIAAENARIGELNRGQPGLGTRTGQGTEFSLGVQDNVEEAPPIYFTRLIQAIDKDKVDPEVAWMFREQYIDEKDWGKVETAIDRARRRSRADRNNAIKQGTTYEAPAYEPIENYLPTEAVDLGDSTMPSGSFLGATGDVSMQGSIPRSRNWVTLPSGEEVPKEPDGLGNPGFDQIPDHIAPTIRTARDYLNYFDRLNQ
tara:strand:- start:1508 stop:2350 length:843 start_codon:yes stop_codon:yes gene_type:complete